MSAIYSKAVVPDRRGQGLLDDVVCLIIDLLIASGATLPMIGKSTSKALSVTVERKRANLFTELGVLQRDCMEVMCTWRRDTQLIDENGEPMALDRSGDRVSFESLCKKAGCTNDTSRILQALLDFGAVSIGEDQKIRSETPTFLLGHVGHGLLATDGLLKQLEGYLRTVHYNVSCVGDSGKPRFERACTVTIAAELAAVFDQLVRRRGQEFVDSIDEWLERNSKHESASGRYVELGAGAYFIDLGERALATKNC